MKAFIWGVLLAIDGGVYDFICYLFEIFYFLCGLQLFSDTDYNSLVQKVYVILGLVMMFVLAYSLLKAVINPDEFAKGETSFPKLIQNVIVSLIIIVFLPTAFQMAFSIQNSILNYDTIPNLILDDGSNTTGTTGPTLNANEVQNVSGGRAIAFYTFEAFLFPDLGSGELSCSSDDPNSSTCRSLINGNGEWGSTNGPKLTERDKAVLEGKNSFAIYGNYSESVRDNKLTYYFPISTVAGIFIAYVMLNFCFDMALRVVKLAFYQIIAPIPVICRIIPGGKLKDVFSKWLKQVISLFVEVFVRIGALSFGVFLIKKIIEKWTDGLDGLGMLTGFGQKSIVLALLIMSVIIFVKEIPKIIGDMFGLDTGGMKLGLMDKLAAGGALAAGAVAGGALGSLGKNMVGQFANKKNWLNGDGKVTAGSVLKNVGLGLKTGVGGGVSGARRGFSAGKGAKNLADMRKAAGTAVAGASAAKAKRDAYKAGHQGSNWAGTMWNVATGHVKDTAQSVGEYFGINSLDDLNHEKETAETMQGFYTKMAGYVSDSEGVMSYQSMYDAEMKREIPSSITEFDSSNYNADLEANVRAMQNDSKYSNMSTDDLYRIAGSGMDKSRYTSTRELTDRERSEAIAKKQANLKMYDQLKKLATIQAVNEKLNDKVNGKIVDQRFAEIANQVEVFKNQNASYGFVNDMSNISGVNWDSSWTDIMTSGDASKINDLMKEFKNGTAGPAFFSDSEAAKNHASEVGAEIGKKIQEKKKDNQ